MKLSKSAEKLDKYYERLNKGKAEKIKPDHVEKVIRKLKTKEELLRRETDESENELKKARLEGKLHTAREQINRAEWLLEKIRSAPAA